MKKYLLIIFLFISCSDNGPDNLISKEKMENIIFDIMILNAASGFDLKIDNNLLSDELIYKKHNIDSLSFSKVSFIIQKIQEITMKFTQKLKLEY